MIYSSKHLNETEYVKVAEHYYIRRDEWKSMTQKELHIDLCRCVAERRKLLMFTAQSACAVLNIARTEPYEMRPHCISEKFKGTDFIRWYFGKRDANAKMASGLLVPGSMRVVCDLVKSDPPESLLVSINDCLTKKMFSKEKLFDEIESRPGMKNRNLLKRLVRFSTENCQSPLETIAWLAVYKAGLTMPQQQVVFRNNSGDFVGRVDMYWELTKKKLVLELDGHVKYEKRQDVIKEKKREDALRALGLDVVRADWQTVKSGDFIQRLIEKGVKPRRHFKGTFPCK